MSRPESRNLPVREEITDIELNAEDIMTSLLRTRTKGVSRSMTQPAQTSTPARAGASKWQLCAVMGAAAVAALAGVSYLYALPGVRAPAPPPMALEVDAPPPVAAPEPVKAPVPVGPIVRIKNPFDKHEVFEFPPGTSEADAHAAVADLLMQRATERRALYSSNPTRHRKST